MKKYQKLAIILSLGLSLIGCGGVGTEEDPALLPIAVNDIATVIENGAEITILVLDNDKPNGQFNASTVKIITDPESAESFSVVPSTGAVKYKPKLGFFGTDSLVYQVENSKGNFSNPATVAITVTQLPDKTAPVITINGGDETIEVGTAYNDKGAAALDDRDGVVPVSTLSTVKKDIPGSYTVTYTATDAAANTATAIRKVTVVDKTAPVITINGGDETIEAGTGYIDKGAIAFDKVDGVVTVTALSTVKEDIPGSYTVTYTATDAATNTATAIRKVTVADKTAPVITINGGDETIEAGTSYIDKGATALDKVDGVVTVAALSTVKEDIPGSYTVTYTATDAATNTATAIRKVTVADSTPPVITMKGSSTVSIEKLKQYIDDGATAIDNIDGAIPVSVVSTVDTNVVADNYTVTYTATDNQGNKTEAIRYVSVTPEIITLIGADHIHKNCDGTVDKTGPDTNDNGILEDSEVTTLENAAYTEGPPVTREELDSMIKKNDNLVSINTCEIEDMSSLFLGKADFNQNIIKWNVGSVTNMSKMFENATTFNGNIGSWDVRSVTDMSQMFRGASRFLDGNIDAWGDKTKNVTRMDAMFDQATAFNGNIGSWDVSSVTDMSLMFFVASSFADGNIGAWGDKTKNVKEMDHMFSNTPFNGDIGNWNVSSVIDMEDMFRGASDFVDGNIGKWKDDVKNVENMRFMFNRTSSFNGDISGWNVSSVKEMDAMFENATTFNGNIGSWDVSSVTNMKRMFEDSGFDQDIGNWDVSLVTDMTDMFKGITLTATNYNKLLIGWWNIIAQGGSLQPGVNFDGGNSALSSAEAIKPWLQLQNHPSVAPFANSPNWTITDGGCKIQGCP